ncbi:hypothetical protein [Acetobacter sacchari]|nr:hypothetical protein [Acetobacter sacchari]
MENEPSWMAIAVLVRNIDPHEAWGEVAGRGGFTDGRTTGNFRK